MKDRKVTKPMMIGLGTIGILGGCWGLLGHYFGLDSDSDASTRFVFGAVGGALVFAIGQWVERIAARRFTED